MSKGPRLGVAVEDRFIVLRMWEPQALLPEDWLLDRFAQCMESFSEKYTVLLDVRELPVLTVDVIEVVRRFCQLGAQALAYRGGEWEWAYLQRFESRFGARIPTLWVKGEALPLRYAELNLHIFEEDHDDSRALDSWALDVDFRDMETDEELEEDDAESELSYEDSWIWMERVHQKREELQRFLLQSFIDGNGRNSLLNEFVIQTAADQLIVTPYHRHAFHEIQAGNQLLVGRPAVFAARTASVLRDELAQLQRLLGDRRTSEAAMQAYLENHPAIFNWLGYAHVYPQIVLQRHGGTSLRPDFILQPVGDEWCDILELKRPQVPVVGRRDRKTLSSSIHELVAQLREYAAFFEDERLAKRIEDVYGIKCYRPKLIGVVGRMPRLADPRQARRLMTQYADVDILTFDQLLALAKSRLLI